MSLRGRLHAANEGPSSRLCSPTSASRSSTFLSSCIASRECLAAFGSRPKKFYSRRQLSECGSRSHLSALRRWRVNTVGCYGNVWAITFALTIAVDRRRNENASTKVLNETTLTERAPNPCRVTSVSKGLR